MLPDSPETEERSRPEDLRGMVKIGGGQPKPVEPPTNPFTRPQYDPPRSPPRPSPDRIPTKESTWLRN